MKEILFLLADLWMISAGFYCGWKFLRRYDNYLLGLEWIVVAASAVLAGYASGSTHLFAALWR